jgi:glycosyltransferase involved in cell wall biosynthesis
MMKRLKIAIFTDTFIPLLDGIVTTTINLAKGLADRGHKIYIIAPRFKELGKEFAYKNVKVKRMPSIPAFFYTGYKFTSPLSIAVIRYLKKEKIDIIHFQTPIGLGAQALFAARFLKKPIIGTFHTFFTDPQYIRHAGINNRFIQRLSWFYVRRYYNRCDLVTCPSESARKELLEHGFTSPVRVISNGIKISVFDNSNWKSMKLKYNSNGKILLFVGRIAFEKNLDYLLDCFKLVLKKHPNVKLVIVGYGPQMNDLKESIIQKDLDRNVVLTGRIEHDKLVKSGIFKASDLFITASTTETQGISTLEAQANGLVCVGIESRGIKDLVKNGYNGYLTENGDKQAFADKVIKLLTDKKLADRMKKNTLKEVKNHRIENVIKIWEKTYSELVTKYEK